MILTLNLFIICKNFHKKSKSWIIPGTEMAAANMLRYGLMNNRSNECGLKRTFPMESKSYANFTNVAPRKKTAVRTSNVSLSVDSS